MQTTQNDNPIINRLTQLRVLLEKYNIDALIVPTADPHLSEYLPEYWQLREWLSGFTGSAGTLVVTTSALASLEQDTPYAGLWADSRYWLQGDIELQGSGIELQKLGTDNTYMQWLAKHMPADSTVAVDGNMLSLTNEEQLLTALSVKQVYLTTDDLNALWKELWQAVSYDEPQLPTASVYAHDAQFVSQTATQKLAQVKQHMDKLGATHHLVSSLDDIAWLTNLRGADVDYNPVFLSHVLISENTATLFIDKNKVSTDIEAQLAEAGYSIDDYDNIGNVIATLGTSDTLLVDPNKVAVATLERLNEDCTIIQNIAPSTLLKSQKTPQDINNVREAMRQDGTALCQFFAAFERKLGAGERLSELDVDSMLIEYRSQQAHYVSPSFPTIAGFNGNGAIVHYRATADNFSYLDGDGLLLIDSGAQYQNGTTDITRVVPIGDINKEQQRDFTAVLKAHIALAVASFPKGIASPLVDAICRAPLWAMQMDYGHGTGHGVGYFLNVHEGPQVIAYSAPVTNERAMQQGMISSNEPGLYRTDKWGIRIENLVVNQAVDNPTETAFGEYLHFETLTYCPIDTRLVDKDMLNQQEVTWLNDYHQKVFAELSPRLDGEGLSWLTERTKAI